MEYLIRRAVHLGVDIRLNTEVTPDLIKAMDPDFTIAAVGSKPLIPRIKGVGKACPIMDMYDGRIQVGQRVVIIGGGLAGTEAAIELAAEGRDVTLVEMAADIAREANSIHRPHMMKKITALGEKITILRSTTCGEVTDTGIVCTDRDGKSRAIEADTVILSAGMLPRIDVADALELPSRDFRMIGDCKKPRQIAEAIREGYDAAMEI